MVMLGGLAGLILGLVAGSFIAALTLRWPASRGIVVGRSQCDTCNAVLTPRDLVPVLSFAWLRGHCRHCGAVIDPRHLWIELAGGGIGLLALIVHPGVAGVAGAIFGWGLLGLAILDVEHFWLPDRLTLPLGVAGLLAGFAVSPGLVDRGIGAVTGFASLAAIAWGYRAVTGRTGMGGGDPKLFAAIGAWLGWQLLPFVLFLAAALGLALAALAAARGQMIDGRTRLALGALLAVAAWPVWLMFPDGLSDAAGLAMALS